MTKCTMPTSAGRLAGALSGIPPVVRGDGRFVRCPTCLENTPDDWKTGSFVPEVSNRHIELPLTRGDGRRYPGAGDHFTVDFMYCANSSCRALVVRAHHTTVTFGAGGVPIPRLQTLSWVIWPKFGAVRPIDPLIPEPYRTDYLEASAILDVSPRMSAVLSRRILADLLETYAGQDNYRLSNRVDTFIEDATHPRSVRQNLHALRSIADFGAHTKRDKNDQAVIIDVTREQAEWTLNVIDRLFDYFIVEPAKDAAIRDGFNQQRIASGQNPLPDLPDDGGQSR